MDKSDYDEIVGEVRLRVQALAELLNELDDYLAQLRRETVVQVEKLAGPAAAEIIMARTYESAADTTDPRRPYLAGRQPRRDGDTYGSVRSHDDNPTGTVRPPGKR